VEQDSQSEEGASAHAPVLQRFDVGAGIIGSVFGVLSVVALALLPSNTAAEKALILTACLALALGTYTGVGAWHSARRFTVTAAFAGVSLIAVSVLSIAAAGDKEPQRKLAAGNDGSTPPTV
jgi:hypothetical protein